MKCNSSTVAVVGFFIAAYLLIYFDKSGWPLLLIAAFFITLSDLGLNGRSK